ncbi:MAG: ABC transporter ATP-binding protein [Methanoregula sp.]|jgi:lipopolysaccharide transport system ATP-binding protein|uniref:ABC transporter ATP-binding protein n=1 Tax=Methanoregula sp. TaxID=2052170 RepID=UPI003C1379C4
MSSNHPAIRVSHLSKQYRLGGPQEPYHTFRDAIVNSLKAPMKIFHKAPPVEGFWALKDVSFEVEPGEVVGIIGRNGAGKSTLLKILSRITSPTEGTVELHGRVGSLLEVGTGFHPELTGRENIYLSGSILGMKRKEIDAKLDEIVKFSGVERFLDTPVKRYSSGMQVRLGFSVAAFLEPEILIVDEVLAVGDAQFQKKCLGKMEQISKGEGRTVLFVSHNMGAIAQLCNRCIVLHSGNVQYSGAVRNSIDYYLSSEEINKNSAFKTKPTNTNYFEFIGLQDKQNNEKTDFGFDEDIVLVIKMKIQEWHPSLDLSISIYSKIKIRIFTFNLALSNYYSDSGMVNLKITLPSNFLVPGAYSWFMCINHPNIKAYDPQDDVCPFNILETGSMFSKFLGIDYGCVYPPHFKIEHLTNKVQ